MDNVMLYACYVHCPFSFVTLARDNSISLGGKRVHIKSYVNLYNGDADR